MRTEVGMITHAEGQVALKLYVGRLGATNEMISCSASSADYMQKSSDLTMCVVWLCRNILWQGRCATLKHASVKNHGEAVRGANPNCTFPNKHL